MTNGTICWVVALLPEAKPLIEKLEMKLFPQDTLHPIYRNETGTDWLVVSGIGQLNAASGSATLYQVCPKANVAIWVNIGIAGSQTAELGELIYINAIRKDSTNRIFYPFVFPNLKIKHASLVTCDSPQTTYGKDYVVDMEAWAFYKAIYKKVSREFIAVFKVISDDSEESMNALSSSIIYHLISDKLESLENFRIKAQNLSHDEFRRQSDPEIFKQLVNNFHFSFTQTQQLKRSVKRWYILFPNKSLISAIQGYDSAQEILRRINEILDDAEVDWGEY